MKKPSQPKKSVFHENQSHIVVGVILLAIVIYLTGPSIFEGLRYKFASPAERCAREIAQKEDPTEYVCGNDNKPYTKEFIKYQLELAELNRRSALTSKQRCEENHSTPAPGFYCSESGEYVDGNTLSANSRPTNTRPAQSGTAKTSTDCKLFNEGYVDAFSSLVKPDSSPILPAIGTDDYERVKSDYNSKATAFNKNLDSLESKYRAAAAANNCSVWSWSIPTRAILHK